MATKTLTRSMTYAEFVAAIQAGALNKGESITITDFQTTHYMCNGNGVINDPVTSEPVINTGPIERLVVHAISNNSIAPISHSLDFPEDEICWDWNPDNWIQDIGFSADQATIIPNFKGVIFRRFDVVRENLVGYDFRTVKFRRWKKNFPIYSAEGSYGRAQIVQVPGDGCYVSMIADNQNNAVSDVNKWTKIIDYAKSEYWEYDNTVAQDVTDYQDYLTFVEFGTPYERAVKNVKFSPFRDTQDQFWGYIGGILANNVFFLSPDDNYSVMNNSFGAFCELNTFDEYFEENSISAYFNNNSIGLSFYNNSIGPSFYNNSIGAYFNNNSIGAYFNHNSIGPSFNSNSIGAYFSSNSIGANFYNNSIGANFNNNSIGANFYNNSIGAYFYNNSIGSIFYNNSIGPSFNNNSIGANFYGNSIGVYFYNNSIGAYFYNNSIGAYFNLFTLSDSFKQNNVKDNLSGLGIDFSASTHIYADYNCELLKTSTGTIKLKYVDGSDNTEKIVNVNA